MTKSNATKTQVDSVHLIALAAKTMHEGTPYRSLERLEQK